MRKNFLKKTDLFIAISVIFLLSCGESSKILTSAVNPPQPPEPPGPPQPASRCITTSHIIYSSACTVDAGCLLSFVCPMNQSESRMNFFNSYITKTFSTIEANTEQLVITSITTVDSPALLQSTPGLVPESWYSGNTTLQCTNDNGQINCPQFGVLANTFDIVGTLGDREITIHTTVESDVSKVSTVDNLVGGCGQFASMYQRMFDCSQRVIHFAGIGQFGNASVDFTPGTPDPNWFLVACPVYTGTTIGTDTTSQQCSWLSPKIQTGNPVIGINKNPPNTGVQDTTSPNLGPGAATRILWSGALNNSATYDFWMANGTTATAPDVANCDGSGLCANYLSILGSIAHFDSFASFSDPFSPRLNLPNICNSQVLLNDNAFSGMTSLSWIMPSYPILMTLTGGSVCQLSNDTTFACNVQGFSAISAPIPNFLSDGSGQSYLASSSVTNAGNSAIEFEGDAGFVEFSDGTSHLGIRCVNTVSD